MAQTTSGAHLLPAEPVRVSPPVHSAPIGEATHCVATSCPFSSHYTCSATSVTNCVAFRFPYLASHWCYERNAPATPHSVCMTPHTRVARWFNFNGTAVKARLPGALLRLQACDRAAYDAQLLWSARGEEIGWAELYRQIHSSSSS